MLDDTRYTCPFDIHKIIEVDAPMPSKKTLIRLVLLPLFAGWVGILISSAGATEQAWIDLGCDAAREAWQGDGSAWTLAGDATQDPKEPSDLIAQPGTGVLVSLLHEESLLSNLTSSQEFGDIEAHVEFLIPAGSNGGVKFQGLYEIQICDTHDKEKPAADDCGGIYPRAEEQPRYHLIDEGVSPRTNAAKPAGQWQTLDVIFQSPRFSPDGQKTKNARFIKVVLNDQVIHENVELKWPTGHAWRTKTEAAKGPLFLQGDHGPIAYRNVRVKPIAIAEEVKIIPDVVYGHKSGMALTFDVFQPANAPNGAGVLFMVSGGWYSGWSPPEGSLGLFKPLTDKGFTVFAVRHGSSPKFSIPEAVEDVRRSVRFIRHYAKRFEVDPERLGVYGGSAGGHLSLMLGTASDDGNTESDDPVLRTSDRVSAVVALVPPTDLRIAVWEAPESLPAYKGFPALDLPLEQAAEYSPLVHVSADDPPTLLLAGAKDELVPIKHSHLIRDAFQEHHVVNELVVFEEAGHGFNGEDLRQAMSRLVGWFETHLDEKQIAEQ
jgi:acetyl esterase/lipase